MQIPENPARLLRMSMLLRFVLEKFGRSKQIPELL